MKDLVPKGTGNSRLLRSSIPADITFAEMVTMLRNGTFPVDFAGLNADGVAVVGSAYNKANVLPDDVCTDLGIATTSEPKDAFLGLKSSIDEVRTRIVYGSYVGNSTAHNTPISINIGFKPTAVFVYEHTATSITTSGIFLGFCSSHLYLGDKSGNNANYISLEITSNGFKSYNNEHYYLNFQGVTYGYIAIKEV